MSRFGLRKKIKRALGFVDSHQEQRATPQPKSPVVTSTMTPSESTPVSSAPKPSVPTVESTSAPVDTQPTSEQDEKILKHRRRTKIALLKLTAKSNGTAALGDLHDLAERRYFIAHKAFSDLMEEMVAEGVFLYDWSAGEASITELGTQWIENDAKGKKK